MYPAVMAEGFAVIRPAYLERFPFVGKPIAVKNGTSALSGVVNNLSPQGTLLLQTKSGLQEILIGDVIV